MDFRFLRNEKLIIITIILFIFIFYQTLLIDDLSKKEALDRKQVKNIQELSSSFEEEFCEIDKIEECLSSD